MADDALKALRATVQQYASAFAAAPVPTTAVQWDSVALLCECLASCASAYAQRARAMAEDLDQ